MVMQMTEPKVNDIERKTQDRVIAFLSDTLGYRYLGNEMYNKYDHPCLDKTILRDWLKKQNKYNDAVIDNVISELEHKIGECRPCGNYSASELYEVNKRCYTWMRNGIPVQNPDTARSEVVTLIDWSHPEKNDFAIQEEVWFKNYQSSSEFDRADVIVYLNGMVIADIELKKARTTISEAVTQLQRYVANNLRWFVFNTLLVAGNESQGVKYGAIGAKDEYYMQWQEDEPETLRLDAKSEIDEIGICRRIRTLRANTTNVLFQGLTSLFDKARLLDLMRWGILYDGGIKKIVRYHQYFGLVAARQRLTHGNCHDGKGGIIWHTQGSGKTITMICILRWILESLTPPLTSQIPRILIVTDREELDDNMESVLLGNTDLLTVKYRRAESRTDLCDLLEENSRGGDAKIICTLIHKFLKKNYDGFEKNDANFVKEIEQIGKLNIRGQFYIFIDECHRSQAGAMHAAMQRIIPNGIFIGFTGTPITKADKNTANRLSEVIFGRFIHCYKYDKAVKDNVVLRLRYDARLVGLKLSKKEKLDDEIENHLREKYKDLKGVQREYFYRRVAEKIYDDPERLSMIVDDIISDFKPRVTVPNKPIPRLQCGGNAMLAVKDIYRACKYYQTFRDNGFYECAVVASDFGDAKALDRNDDSDSCYKAKTFKELLEYYNPSAQDWKNAQNWMNERWMNEREVYEKYIIEKFKKEPNNLKLLIVVDKLLTGFDAPHCSVLYLDKPMKDHTMFQAICRVNRLDDDSKKWGLIVDYCFQLDPILDAMGRYTGSDINIPGYDPEDLVGMIQLSKDAAYSEFINMLDTLNELCRDLFDERGEIDNDSALAYFLRDGDENSLQHRREDLFQYSKSLIRNYHAMPGELQAEYYNDFKKYARLLQFIQVNLGGCEKHEITSTIHNILHKYIKVDDDIKSLKSLENLTDLAACDSPINVVNKLIEQFKKQLNINDDNDDDSKRHSADIIRGNVGSEIRRRFDTDPEKYRKLSEILEDILNKYEEGQKSLAEMLDGIKNDIIDKLDQVDDIPDLFKSARNPIACDVLYRNLIDVFVPEECEIVVVEIDQIMVEKAQVEWRSDQQKRGYVEECIWEVIEKHGKADEQTLKLVMDLIDKQDAY